MATLAIEPVRKKRRGEIPALWQQQFEVAFRKKVAEGLARVTQCANKNLAECLRQHVEASMLQARELNVQKENRLRRCVECLNQRSSCSPLTHRLISPLCMV